jgi:hypothetical protein
MTANYYQLERLKTMCEQYIENGVDVENVAWLYGMKSKFHLLFLILILPISIFTDLLIKINFGYRNCRPK